MGFHSRFKGLFSFLILFAVGARMLSLSWQKWADIRIDFGRELYEPWQINNGEVLHRDIACYNGPISSYFNALLFKVFGTHVMTLAVFNIALIALLTFIIYHIFIKMTDWITAASISLTFLTIFAFSEYGEIGNYNFVCPYSYSLTHGIFLAFLLIYFFLIYLETRQQWVLFVMGLVLGTIFLTKIEVFIASAAALSAGMLLILFINRGSLLKSPAKLALFITGFLIPIFLFVAYFSHYMSFIKAVLSIIFPYTIAFSSNISLNIFYRHLMGTDDVLRNLMMLALEMSGYIVMFFSFASIAYSLRRMTRDNFAIYGTILILSLLLLLESYMLGLNSFNDVLRPLPVVMLILGGYSFISLLRFRTNAQSANRFIGLLVLTIFALLLTWKMILNVHLYHYGFALAMPATLLLVSILMYYIPAYLGKDAKVRIFLIAINIILLSGFLVTCMNISKKFYSQKTVPIGSGLDTMYDFDPRVSTKGIQTQQAINIIERTIKKNETFIAFPEGAMLNYLTKRVNPTPYLNFMATELTLFGENETLNSFIKNKPDYIVLVDKDLSEFGCPMSGDNCGNSILNWINKNYSPEAKIGNTPLTGNGFGILICKRNISS